MLSSISINSNCKARSEPASPTRSSQSAIYSRLRKIFFEKLKNPAATETCGVPRHDQSLLDVMAIRARRMPR
jgi:hypothetical protein